jgi:hypothetical protein
MASLPGGPHVPFLDPAFGYSGSLTFSPASTAAPEPTPLILMLLGAGLIFLMRKRFIIHMPRTS